MVMMIILGYEDMQSVNIFVGHFRMVVILGAKTNTKIGQNVD